MRINKLAELAAADQQPALAITDSFNLFGAFDFTQKMMEVGIQPIIGAVVSLRDQMEQRGCPLAQSEVAINLSDLISKALLTTDPNQNQKFFAKIWQNQKAYWVYRGLSFWLLGQPAWHGQNKITARRAKWLKSVFGMNAYIELQRHGRAQEQDAEASLLMLADETGLPLVATNDCHFETEQCMCRSVFQMYCPV